MKVLYIAPIDNFTARDGGYGNASGSILYVLNKMKEEKRIDELVVVNSLKPIPTQDVDYSCDVALVAANPYTLVNPSTLAFFADLLSESKKAYLTVLWETIPLPKAWNVIWETDIFDGFLAPSYFIGVQLKMILDKVAKEKNKSIYYHPYYIHTDVSNLIDIEKKKNEDVFSVLFMGQNTKRKGISEAIIAFSRTFDKVKDAQLIVKYHNLSNIEQNVESLIKEYSMTNQCCKFSKIYTIDSNLDNNQIIELYKTSSLLMIPSRGEGFNLPGPEAMSVGLPVIYNDWSASSEVCESPYNYPVEGYIDEAVNMYHYGYEIGSKYAFPSISDLMKGLNTYYADWKKDKVAYYTKAASNQQIISERFSYDVVSACLENVFKEGTYFAPMDIFNTRHWEHNMKQYKEIVGVE